MSRPIRPTIPLGRPPPSFSHVCPALVVLEMPAPKVELWRLFASPVPAQTMSGLEGLTARSPIDDTASCSKIGSHVVPLFVVFQMPPEADPTYITHGVRSTTATSSI